MHKGSGRDFRRMFAALSLAVAVAMFWVGGALAQSRNVGLPAFYGRWQGSGISESETSIYFQLTARDLDVVIQPGAGDGFTISWTTVTRQKGDPRNPTVDKKSQSITFVSSGRPNVWKQAQPADPVTQPYAWASIQGNTLTVTNLVIDPTGSFEFQVYRRTLTGGMMELTFTRIRDGEKQRDAKGRLVKVANQ